MDTFKLLQMLTETPGPSGFEADVAAVIEKIWQPLADEIETDRLGNLIALKKGRAALRPGEERRPLILIAAHMDEIGLMVSQIIDFNGRGFLRVDRLGGVDTRHIYGQRVVVHGRGGESGVSQNLKGIIAGPPDYLLPEDKHGKPYDFETLVVDPGLPYETLRKAVSVGDAVTFNQPLRKLQGEWVAGKALDNRASVAALTHTLEYLQERVHDWDVLAIATCQEETGLLGASTSAFRYRPDIAIAIDVTFGIGPGVAEEEGQKLGSGPAVSGSPDVHPGISAALKKAAEGIELSVQDEYDARPGGTDAYAMQIAREGIPTGIVSIPLRYMHTMVETIDTRDVERVGRLLGEYITRLDDKSLTTLSEGLMASG